MELTQRNLVSALLIAVLMLTGPASARECLSDECKSKMTPTAVKAELEAAETAASAAKIAAAEAEKKLAKLAFEQISKLESDLKVAQTRLNEAEKELREIQEHHTGAWLPHWLEETAGKGLGAAGGALKNATGAAIDVVNIVITFIRTKVLPIALICVREATAVGLKLAVLVEERLAEKNIFIHPAVKKVGGKAQECAEIVATQFPLLVEELESLLVHAAGAHPSLAPLAHKPTTTFLVYFVLFAPLFLVGRSISAKREKDRRQARDDAYWRERKRERAAAEVQAASAPKIKKEGGISEGLSPPPVFLASSSTSKQATSVSQGGTSEGPSQGGAKSKQTSSVTKR
jgi:hypothetical protein